MQFALDRVPLMCGVSLSSALIVICTELVVGCISQVAIGISFSVGKLLAAALVWDLWPAFIFAVLSEQAGLCCWGVLEMQSRHIRVRVSSPITLKVALNKLTHQSQSTCVHAHHQDRRIRLSGC
jgi:hypothetical protein